ncbi:MAG: transglycosylase SLT domain-containing protein [Burkholderiales bacterium]
MQKLSQALSLIAASLLLAGCASLEQGPPEVNSSSRYWGQTANSLVVDPQAPTAPKETVTLVSVPIDVADPPPPKALVQDDLRPDQPSVDFQAPEAKVDLWSRVRADLKLPDLTGSRVQKWEQYYAKRPEYVSRMTARGGRYLFHIVEEVQKRGLPMELALLPFIESAFNPEAMSHARASGMWQFMSATGKDFDLKQNLFRDDRRDVLASTRAALDYLAQLGRRYDGDWQLALAAYNWGMGNVDRAVKRAKAQGLEGRYEQLRMPAETADYVPKLQAIENLVQRPQDFNVILPLLDNHPYFLTVQIERDIDVDLAAELAGLTPEVFRQFNPQMNKPVVLAAATPQLLLPYDNAARFVRELAEYRGPLASWTAWQLSKTMKPADAAKQVGMSEAKLREVNRISGRMLIKAGSTLLVPRTAKHEHDVSEHLADTAALALSPERVLRRQSVKVRKGETLAQLARRHGVTVQQVAEWNKISSSAKIKSGQSLTLMLPARAATQTASAKGPGKKSVRAKSKKAGTRVAQAPAKPPVKRAKNS